MNYTNEKIVKKPRLYFSESLDITKWDNVEKVLKELANVEIHSADELIGFMEKLGEFSDILDEEIARRYIAMTRFADDEKYENAYNTFYSEIFAKVMPYDFQFKQKFYNSPYRKELDEQKYAHLNRIISNEIELFRKENIPLGVEERKLANKYGAIFSKLTVQYKGEEKTISQLAPYMKSPNREVRQEVWNLRNNKMMEKREEFNQLFDEMKKLRIQQAKNAGFDNYRDYMHRRKGRFSYTPEDLFKFHDAVEKEVLPLRRCM